MQLLIAEDDVLFQRMLVQVLSPDYEIVLASNGDEAWEIVQGPDAPRLAILDWVMPGLSGPEICRRIRACDHLKSMYLLLITSKNSEADIVAGLRAGADDYITKPPIAAELRARVRVGERVLTLQDAVAVEQAFARTIGVDGAVGGEPTFGRRPFPRLQLVPYEEAAASGISG
jgi:DNA-binding response OmpR family regulator